MRKSHLTALFSVLLATFGSPTLFAADPLPPKAAAKLLLEKGWDKTAAARALADAPSLDAPPLSKDPLVLFARWLVFMHQGRYDDALSSVQAFIKAPPADLSVLSAMRAEVWIYTVKKDYRQAMISADRLGQAVVAAQPAGNKPATSLLSPDTPEAALAFLGRFAGFLEGPAAKNADQNLRKKFEAALLTRLAEPQKKQFAEVKAFVLDDFRQLTTSAADAAQGGKQAAEADKEKKLADLSKEKEEIVKGAAKVEEKAKQVAEELKRKLAEFDRQDAPLIARITTLQTELNLLTPQFNQQQANANRLQQQANSEQNPQLRPQRQNEALQAQNTFNTTQTRVNNLTAQIAGFQQQRDFIQQQRLAAGGGAILQGQQLNNLQQGIEQDKFKNKNKQKRAENTKPTTPGKALVLETQAHAFSTYDEFPFDDLRDSLLSKLK